MQAEPGVTVSSLQFSHAGRVALKELHGKRHAIGMAMPSDFDWVGGWKHKQRVLS